MVYVVCSITSQQKGPEKCIPEVNLLPRLINIGREKCYIYIFNGSVEVIYRTLIFWYMVY